MPAKSRTTTKAKAPTGAAGPGATGTGRGRAGVTPHGKAQGAAGKTTARTKATKPPAAKTPAAKTRTKPQSARAAGTRVETSARATPDGATLPDGLDAPMLFIEFQSRLLEMHPDASAAFDGYVWLIETLGAVGGDPVGVLLGAIEARAGTGGLRARMEALLADPASAAGMPPEADPGYAGTAGPTDGHQET